MQQFYGIVLILIITIILSKSKCTNAFSGLTSYRNIRSKFFIVKRYKESTIIVFRKQSNFYMESEDEDVAQTDSTDPNTRQHDVMKTQVHPHRIGGRRETKRRSNKKSSMLLTSLK